MAEKRKPQGDGGPASKRFRNFNAQFSRMAVQPGAVGLLFTVDPNHNKSAIQEIKALVGQHLLPSTTASTDEGGEVGVEEEQGSIADLLRAELATMQATTHRSGAVGRVETTQVPGNMFVALPSPSPSNTSTTDTATATAGAAVPMTPREALLRLCRAVAGAGGQSCRYVYRCYAAGQSCRAYIPAVKDAIRREWELFEQREQASTSNGSNGSTTTERVPVEVYLRTKNNTDVNKAHEELRNYANGLVARSPLFRPSFRGEAEVVLHVTTLQSITFVGVTEGWTGLRGYNLKELGINGLNVEPPQQPPQPPQPPQQQPPAVSTIAEAEPRGDADVAAAPAPAPTTTEAEEAEGKEGKEGELKEEGPRRNEAEAEDVTPPPPITLES